MTTASVTGLGLLPLAVASGTAGREIEGPMVVVILGGLVTSTPLNLLLLPTFALRFGRFGGSSPRQPEGAKPCQALAVPKDRELGAVEQDGQTG
jgi:hypothetical protein